MYSAQNLLFQIDFRIVESNLHKALTELMSDVKAVNSHYDGDACMRQKHCVKELLEGARLLDEQDLEGLSLYLLDHKVVLLFLNKNWLNFPLFAELLIPSNKF